MIFGFLSAWDYEIEISGTILSILISNTFLGYVKIILYATGDRDGYKSYEDLYYIYSEWNC